MLPKQARLTTMEVKKVLTVGRGKRGTLLSIKTLSSPPPFRCAVIVSKKIAKNAVTRNRVRRGVYEALSKSSLPQSGHAILFVQAVPRERVTAVFMLELKKLLHV